FENILGSILKFFKNPIINDLNGNLLILDFNGWLYLVFIVLYVALIISLAFYFHKEEKLLDKPFIPKVGYKYLITIGFLGMHHFYLFQKKKAYVFWGIIFVFILINLHLFAKIISFPQYTFDINSYSYFSRVLIILIIYYLIRDAILMHYYCYKQNNKIYRIHFDKDLIIGGQ